MLGQRQEVEVAGLLTTINDVHDLPPCTRCVMRRSFRSGVCLRLSLRVRWSRRASEHERLRGSEPDSRILRRREFDDALLADRPASVASAENVTSFTPSPMTVPCSAIPCRFKSVRS